MADGKIRMGLALCVAWFELTFAIVCALGQDYLTFNQAARDIPAPSLLVGEPCRARSIWAEADDLAWSDGCGRNEPFSPVVEPDAGFPMLQWCRCATCGYANAVGWCRVTFQVGTGIHRDHRVGTYLPQPDAPIGIVADRPL